MVKENVWFGYDDVKSFDAKVSSFEFFERRECKFSNLTQSSALMAEKERLRRRFRVDTGSGRFHGPLPEW